MRGARSNVAGHLEPELATKPETSFPNPFPEVSGPVLYVSPPVESRLIDGPAAPSYDASFTTDVASTRRTSVTMSDFRSDASSRYVPSTRRLTRSTTNSTSPRRAPSGTSSVGPFYSKSSGATLPPAAGESLANIPTEQLVATRMVVNGRPQDFGSVIEEPNASGPSGGEVSQSYTEHHPPPDYHQATETFSGP